MNTIMGQALAACAQVSVCMATFAALLSGAHLQQGVLHLVAAAAKGVAPRLESDLAIRVQDGLAARRNLVPDDGGELADLKNISRASIDCRQDCARALDACCHADEVSAALPGIAHIFMQIQLGGRRQ